MFPTRMRYSGVSLGYQVTSIVAGSLAPIIASSLLERYNSSTPVAIYLLIACAVTAVSVLVLRETNGISLQDVDAADAQGTADLLAASKSAEAKRAESSGAEASENEASGTSRAATRRNRK
jgi:hypothetical protein